MITFIGPGFSHIKLIIAVWITARLKSRWVVTFRISQGKRIEGQIARICDDKTVVDDIASLNRRCKTGYIGDLFQIDRRIRCKSDSFRT